MIVLKNKGEIEIDAVKYIGASIKVGDNPIGKFGSGLKHAIALFVRENIPLKLFIGTTEFEFYAEKKIIRGKPFNICHMRGPFDAIDLGFAADMGLGWKNWMGYRELASNCLDENGEIFKSEVVRGEEGCTTFVLPDIDTKGIFLADENKTLLFANNELEIYEGGSSVIYYQGIRAKDLEKSSIYTYNVLRKCDLTEDRLLCYDYQVEYAINNAIVSMKDEGIIKDVITAKGTFEASLRMEHYTHDKPSETFTKVVQDNKPAINASVSTYAVKHAPKREPTREEKREDILYNLRGVCDDYNLDARIENGRVIITGADLWED